MLRDVSANLAAIEGIQGTSVALFLVKTKAHPTSDEAQRLAVELSTLSKRQSESLQKAPYLLMPREEREAYDRRRVRIEELRELLSRFSPLETGTFRG
jgi:hypothetical protein